MELIHAEVFNVWVDLNFQHCDLGQELRARVRGL